MKSPAEWTISGHLAVRRPAEQTIPFENHYLNAEDGARIHVWLLLQPNSQEVPTLIYFHGNAGNMGFRLKNAAEMYALSKVNVLMMDYRGYGKGNSTS